MDAHRTLGWIACAGLVTGAVGCRRVEAASTDARPRETVHLETVEAREQPMPRSLALTGTLRGERQADIAANATGRVVRTFVERGAGVKEGDLLAALDVRGASLTAAEAQASAALARAQVDSAQRECGRFQRLLAEGAISAAESDRASDACRTSPLSLQAVESRARAAALVVGDGSIRAPFAGVVVERLVEVGTYVRADSRVVTLVTLDPLKLELSVPEASLGGVKEGAAVSFTVAAYPDRPFQGTIRRVGAAVREATRDVVVEATVPNADRALRPGMFATAKVVVGEAPAPVVPRSALVAKEGLTHAFVVVDRRVEERVVRTGPEQGGLVALVAGVKAGDRVVAAPAPTLQNGQLVD